jgi:hypothetical protein
MYDVDVTGAGEQPTLFDDFCAMYSRFVVLGSRVTATFQSIGSTTATNQAIVGVSMQPSATAGIWDDYVARQHTHYALLAASAGGENSKIAVVDFNPFILFGRDPLVDEEQWGTAAANPSTLAHFHLFATASDGASDLQGVQVLYEIEFVARWMSPVGQVLD